MTTVLLALTASAVIGVSDYLGGRASERAHPMFVALVAQATYLVVAPPLAVVVGADDVTGTDLVWGLVAGVASGGAYLLFFTALSTGRMGVAAPVTAATSAALPVLVDAVGGTDLSTGRWAGLAVALVAVPIVAYTPSTADAHRVPTGRVVVLAAVAGVLFATFFLCLGRTDPASGQWPFVASALSSSASVALACLVTSRLHGSVFGRPPRAAIASGACGAVAGACITTALQRGPVGVATVLGSLFPLVTVGLAARFAAERVRWWHALGLGLAVTGAAAVAAFP